MARTSAKAKKSKQEVNKNREEAKQQEENQTGNDSTGDSTDKENDNTNYDVEKITHTRIFKGKRQYLVRWKGYSEDNDTWENESTLQSCKEILDAFKKEHLIDVNSDDEGTEEGAEEEDTKKGKKTTKKTKNPKKSGRQSKQKKDIEGSEEDIETEEEEKEDKGRNKGKNIEKGEELEEKSKTKETKGKKRNAVKDTGSSESKKSKKDESDDESVTDGKDYEVEKILEVHTRRDGSREFLIRWKGYKPSDDTWEPEAHLDCQELIEKFMEKVEKAKELTKKELRGNRSQTKRFVPLNSRIYKRSQRNSGFRPCYQESYED